MTIENFLVLALIFIAVLVSIEAGLYLTFRYRTGLARWAGLILFSQALELIGYLLAWAALSYKVVQLAYLVQVLAYTLFCIFWLLFIFVFTRHSNWIRPRNLALIIAIPIIYFLMMWAYWIKDSVGNHVEMAVTGSLMFSPFANRLPGTLFVIFGYMIDFFSILVMAHSFSKSNSITRKLLLPLLAGPILLAIAAAMELAGINPFHPVSIHHIAFASVSLLAFGVVFDLRFRNVLSSAREKVVDQMLDGTMILDQEDRIVDLNPAAQQIIGPNSNNIINVPLSQVLPELSALLADQARADLYSNEASIHVNGLEFTYDINISPLTDAYQEPIGRVIVLRNVTGRERMTIALNERSQELARTNTLITALSSIASRIGVTSNSDLMFDTLGSELRGLGLDCGIVTLNPTEDVATIKYLSFHPDIIHTVEKLAGVSAKNYAIPKRYWPDDRAIREKIPIWYSGPSDMLRGMFPQISDSIARNSLQFLGFKPETKLCMLPLISKEQTIGTMLIWGLDLHPPDDAILAVFASQVASILQNTIAHENETKRANELARSNAMILALSKVASRLDSTSNFPEVLDTFGMELKNMGLESVVGLLDNEKFFLVIQYVSIEKDIIHWVEKKTGHSFSEIIIPRKYWPTDKVIVEKKPYWEPNKIRATLNMFQAVPEKLQLAALKLAKIDLDDPLCYLPLVNREEVIGVLAVWGKELREEDLSALIVFTSQLATAITNSRLYNTAQDEIIAHTQAEVRTRTALNEKETLLKEVHHRVKNNLQIISSLLNLQSNQITDQKTRDVLRESQNRVRAMALIHEKLYQSYDLAQIDFAAYLKGLANFLAQSYRDNSSKVYVHTNAQNVKLEIDTAIPCGLIVNELVSNSLKYAFPENKAGEIEISCEQPSSGDYILLVRDNGIGLPPGFDLEKSSTLGIKLVSSLVQQLRGTMVIDNENGVCYKISFSTK